MPPIHILMKPASGLCNLKCTYCFYHDVMDKRDISSYGFMTEETLENVIKKGLEYADHECTIAYQGGEPTLIGLDFFKKSIEFQKKYNKKNVVIHNALQTNGYNLNEEWAKFFVENDFLIGISIDGTKETHDSFRIDNADNPTFNKVFATTKMFDKYKVQYNILTVVNARTAKKIESIYNFFKKNNFEYLQFIPCLNPFGEEDVMYDFTLTPKMYGEFMKNLFDLWYRDYIKGAAIHIRQFENYIEMLLGYPPESCGMSGVCSYQNVVEADGQVYPCDFYVLEKLSLGNLNEVDFVEVNKKRAEIKFVEESTKFDEKCKTCKYAYICRGGCKRYREPAVNGNYSLNCFCESYEMFFEHAIGRLTDTAKLIAQRMNRR